MATAEDSIYEELKVVVYHAIHPTHKRMRLAEQHQVYHKEVERVVDSMIKVLLQHAMLTVTIKGR